MLIVLKSGAKETDIENIVYVIESLGYKAHPMPGANRTAIGITGNRGAIDPAHFENLPGVAEARETLRKQGLFITDIRSSGDAGADSSPIRKKPGRISVGQRLKNIAMFSRQMHVLLSSGTPIVQALNAMERQAEHESWRAVRRSRGAEQEPSS